MVYPYQPTMNLLNLLALLRVITQNQQMRVIIEIYETVGPQPQDIA